MRNSAQDQIKAHRPPRVVIVVDIEINNAKRRLILPFVTGVLGNFSGNRPSSKSLADRDFMDIDADTFNQVLEEMEPTVALDDLPQPVVLTFKHLGDFSPGALAEKVARELMEERRLLAGLLIASDGKDDARHALDDILANDRWKRVLSEGTH